MRRRSQVTRTRRAEIRDQALQLAAAARERGESTDDIQDALLRTFAPELETGEARMYAECWSMRNILDGLRALTTAAGLEASHLEAGDVWRWLRGEVRPRDWLPYLCQLFQCNQAKLGWPAQGNDTPVDFTPFSDTAHSHPPTLTVPIDDPAPATLATYPDGSHSTFRISLADSGIVTFSMDRREFLEAVGGTVAAAVFNDTNQLDNLDQMFIREPLSHAERATLSETLGKNLSTAWALFHTSDMERMLAIGRTQLYTLKQHRHVLHVSVLPSYYSCAYRLLGATYHRRSYYAEALQSHDRAYLAALEAEDAWNMAQTRSWQAEAMAALDRHADALQAIEAALRLVSALSDSGSVRLHARLLSCAAEAAAIQDDEKRADAMLYASEAQLEQLPGLHEEFDRVAWLESAGSCALRLGRLDMAVERLQAASREAPKQWIARHVLTTVGLSTALARSHDREAALAAAAEAIPQLQAVRSPDLNDRFTAFLHTELPANFPNDGKCRAFAAEAENALSAYA